MDDSEKARAVAYAMDQRLQNMQLLLANWAWRDLSCPVCGSLVQTEDKEKHKAWHHYCLM